MNRVFIRPSTIMFLAMISTFPGILTQIMLVHDVFLNLSCGDSLIRTYYTDQANNYPETFSPYLYNSGKFQFIL